MKLLVEISLPNTKTQSVDTRINKVFIFSFWRPKCDLTPEVALGFYRQTRVTRPPGVISSFGAPSISITFSDTGEGQKAEQ